MYRCALRFRSRTLGPRFARPPYHLNIGRENRKTLTFFRVASYWIRRQIGSHHLPNLNAPNAIAAALTNACEGLFAMIESDAALLPVGERLVLALLHEAETQNICNIIIIRRLYAGLDVCKRIAAGTTPNPRRPGLRHG